MLSKFPPVTAARNALSLGYEDKNASICHKALASMATLDYSQNTAFGESIRDERSNIVSTNV
jgi:hypothetical protein